MRRRANKRQDGQALVEYTFVFVGILVPLTVKGQQKPLQFHFEGTGGMKPGLGLVGTDVLLLDGKASGDINGEGLVLGFHKLEWEPGAHLPAQGDLHMAYEGGHDLDLGFDDDKDVISVSVDGKDPVKVPFL